MSAAPLPAAARRLPPTAALLVAAVVTAALVTAAPPARAHELRPSHLILTPRGGGLVDVVFQIALAQGRPLPLAAHLPERCRPLAEPIVTPSLTARTLRWTVDCGPDGLADAVVRVDGLREAGTDVLVSTPHGTTVLHPDTPARALPGPGGASVAAYLGIGVEHILLGPDHLLFVLGLLLLVGRRLRALLATITAFTLAHSVTLALAVLGLVTFPTRAVEAVIALSILLLAWELLQPASAGRSLAAAAPWAFALVCGLLHGFGFAGALADVGLPADRVPAALVLFNVGVELGQLAFVAAVVLLGRLLGPLLRARGAGLRHAAVYSMGGVAAFWFVSRAWPIVAP